MVAIPDATVRAQKDRTDVVQESDSILNHPSIHSSLVLSR